MRDRESHQTLVLTYMYSCYRPFGRKLMGGILEYLITYPNALKNDAQHNVQVSLLNEMQINGRVI